MVIILPSKKYTSAYDYIKRNNDFTKILKNLKTKKEMKLYLPKFELEYERRLKGALKKMNMKKVFEPSAELMKLSESTQLYVSEVIHKTYIKVDEEGSEAAAITAIITKFWSVNQPKITTMNVDRSFVYMIRDKRIKDTNGNEMMLFIGTVNDLSNEKQ
jgi:serpin B